MKKLQFLKAGMESGVSPAQFISINFEDLNYAYLQTAKALHNEITKRATEINGKAYLFFDEIPEVKDWEKCINSLRYPLTATSISPVQTQSFFPVSFPLILADVMWSLLFIHSPLQSSWNCIAPLRQMNRSRNAFKSIFYLELLRRDYKVTVGKTGNNSR